MQKSTGPKTDPFGTPYLTVPSEEQKPRIKTRCTLFLRYKQNKTMSSNCINRQKALRVRFCDQQDQTLFLSPKRHLWAGLIYLQLKTTSLSIVRVGHCKSVYSRSPTEVDEKSLVSPDYEDAVSIQLVMVFLWFGNRSQEAVCLAFGNIALVKAFLVNSVQLSPVLFCQVLDIPVLNPIWTRCCIFPASSKDFVEFLLCEFILAPN